MAVFHRVRATSAADITLPQTGMYLWYVRVIGATVPGHFSWLHNGVNTAVFECPSNGTRGFAQYKVNHRIPGNTIPSGVQTFTGITSVELVFADTAPPAGHSTIAEFNAVVYRRTDAGAVTATISGTYPGGPTTPRGVVVYQSASAGRVTFPSQGGATFAVDAVVSDRAVEPLPAPDLPASPSLDLTAATEAAATIMAVVRYK